MNLEKSKQPTFFEQREYMLFVESWNKGTQVMSCYYTGTEGVDRYSNSPKSEQKGCQNSGGNY